MGYVSSDSSSKKASTIVGKDKDVEKIRKSIDKCMDLISKRNALVEKLNGLDEQIEEIMTEIKSNPQAAEMAKMLVGLIKPTKRG